MSSTLEVAIYTHIAMFRTVVLLFLLLLSPPPTHQFRAHPFTSTTAGVPRVNPCFAEQDSAACLAFIALRRGVSLEAARALYDRARSIYASEETPPAAIYDRATVAIACLASAGTMRPGPDSDCATCGPACGAESRAEVCALYCSRPSHTELITQSYATILSVMSGGRRPLENESETSLNRSLVIALCVCVAIFSVLLVICLMAVAVPLTCRRLSSIKAEGVGGTRMYFRSRRA